MERDNSVRENLVDKRYLPKKIFLVWVWSGKNTIFRESPFYNLRNRPTNAPARTALICSRHFLADGLKSGTGIPVY